MNLTLPVLDHAPVRPAFAVGPRSLDAVKLLRISVTDRCNLRCHYCMPEKGVGFYDTVDLLSRDDIVAVARAAISAGVTHLKLTGGEPTVRKDLLEIVRGLAALKPKDLSLTTNGVLFAPLAKPLRDAGLKRVTFSWDSMDPARFAKITGSSSSLGLKALPQLLAGIQAAEDAAYEQIKINVVVMAGVNDDEVVNFAKLTQAKPWTVRFIEYMPLGDSQLTSDPDRYILDNQVVMQRIADALGELEPVDRISEAGVGPAKVYRLADGIGRIGFISAMSKPFCETCNRLRLTAKGELRSCLFDGGEVDVLPALRPTPDDEKVVGLLRKCVALKPDVHSHRGNRAMSQMGG
jgi:cyclic pyranopterin phosphate synthase